MDKKLTWVVSIDPAETQQAVETLAKAVSLYYKVVMDETNGNQTLAENLTLDYQQWLLGMIDRTLAA